MNNYKQSFEYAAATRFSAAPMSELEFSRMSAVHSHALTFNAGDIVPIYCSEVLPHDTFSQDLQFVIRQSTLLKPTMGQMTVDVYAFFVPNRIVNHSWVNVQGENSSGSWTAPDVSLVSLLRTTSNAAVQIPVGSVADYYGFPTQQAIPAVVLQQCNDLKFRGYLDIYNNYFRDQNYQPPIPFSKLNVYEGFFEQAGVTVAFDPNAAPTAGLVLHNQATDGTSGAGAVAKALYGEGSTLQTKSVLYGRATSWSALSAPLKANKRHDYFTSVLPAPQKSTAISFSLSGTSAPVNLDTTDSAGIYTFASGNPLLARFSGTVSGGEYLQILTKVAGTSDASVGASNSGDTISSQHPITGLNLTATADLSNVTAVDLATLRDGAAVQQVFETLARSGSRYREFISGFFGLDTDDTFPDVPVLLGHVSRDLTLYQTAQTSESGTTPQGNLAAFGYTDNGGSLYAPYTFTEHGYLHVLAVVRHKNIYSSYLAPDNFRMNMLDFYTPQLANISEQPVRTVFINPFAADPTSVFGYGEAWSEYRFEPNRVSGYFRPGVNQSLSVWNYADDFDSGLTVADADFMRSNSQEVLDRTLATTSAKAPQFLAEFAFKTVKQRPMPTYSIPGLDII